MSARLLLVTGGARSGKSRYALARAAAHSESVLFVATGVATDDEMAARIARHRAERPPAWRTLEARYALAEALASGWQGERCLLLDDLATLVSNLLIERSADENDIGHEVDGLLAQIGSRSAEVIVVTNEVGLGLVPPSPLGRRFRDLLGVANQRLAAAADEVVLLVAGLPLHLKA